MSASGRKLRPLSPHIQIYKKQITSVLSILHRITGVLVGLGLTLVVMWLLAMATGPAFFDCINNLLSSWLGSLIMFGFTYALLHHLCGGIRHLLWDIGWGFEQKQVDLSGYVAVSCAFLLTILIWSLA